MSGDEDCGRSPRKKFAGMKRSEAIDWEHYFMGVAFLAAHRSKDPVTQVGACIVDKDNKIVGVGYNGFPKGCDDDEFPWAKGPDLMNKMLYVCHAELNAILNTNISNTTGCRMYVALFPCNECAKCIIQAGIKEVIYKSDKKHNSLEVKASKKMFDSARVSYRQFIPNVSKLEIDFNKIDS